MSRSGLSPVEHQVQSALDLNFGNTAPAFVIGVSGGADSMCLLHVFQKLKVDAFVVHINYGKRGEESDKDAEMVEQMAFQWGFDCQTIKADPADAENQNFQQWARSIRYDIFRVLQKEYGAAGIALAHHQDDQIETILQKLFRGAGLESWSAMEVWNGEIFRPLLHTSREEITSYCEQEAVPFRTDQSNLESEFARNFLRNEWLKKLEGYFPGWKQNVLRISEQAELFSGALAYILEGITTERDRIAREPFLELDDSLAKALILHFLKDIDPDIEVSADALAQLEKIGRLQTGKSIQLTETFSILRDRQWFKIVYEQSEPPEEMKLERHSLQEEPRVLDDITLGIERYEDPDFQKNLYLDASKLNWPLYLRRWENGDRFQPLGMEGHQKVSDYLTNQKVSAAQKNDALVVETAAKVICAVIFPSTETRLPPGTIADWCKCEAFTQQSLTIKRS